MTQYKYMLLSVTVLCVAVVFVERSMGQGRKSVSGAEVSYSESKSQSFFSAAVHGNIELPAFEPNDSLVYNEKGRYTLQYSPSNRSALWVAYKLTSSDVRGDAGRSNSFKSDPELRRRGFHVAHNDDYKGSGYDKGHLLPSADRKWSAEENKSTFLLSNCSPQAPALNRGTWRVLEESIRLLCQKYDTLYVVVGIVPDKFIGRLGKTRISIPRNYFKAFVARRGNHYTTFAYIMPNSGYVESDRELYRVSIREVEIVTGLDLFPSL